MYESLSANNSEDWRQSSFRSFLLHLFPDSQLLADTLAPIVFRLALQFGTFPFAPGISPQLDFEGLYRAWVFLSGSEGHFLSRWEEISEDGTIIINRRGFTKHDRRRLYFEALANNSDQEALSGSGLFSSSLDDNSFEDVLEVVTLLQPGLTDGYLGSTRSQFVEKSSKLPKRRGLGSFRLFYPNLKCFLTMGLLLQRAKKLSSKSNSDRDVHVTQIRAQVNDYKQNTRDWEMMVKEVEKSFGIEKPQDAVDWICFDAVLQNDFVSHLTFTYDLGLK